MRRWCVALVVALGASGVSAETPKKVDAAAVKDMATRLAAAKKAGRAAAKAKDYTKAADELRKAVELDPNDPALLGELGWVLYLGGSLDPAEKATRQAIRTATTGASLGALYYNLGRIAEDRGDFTMASDHYRRSIALRPNETVSKRLEKLPGGRAVTSHKTAEALCPEAKSGWYCGSGDEDALLQCTCKVVRTVETEQASWGGAVVTDAEGTRQVNPKVVLRAAILEVAGQGMGALLDRALAVETGSGGWQLVGSVATDWTPGAFGINNTGQVEAAEAFSVQGAHPPAHGEGVLVRALQDNVDTDMGVNLVHTDKTRSVWLCGANDAGPACLTFTVFAEGGTDRLIDEEPVEDELKGSLGIRTWELSWERDTHKKLVITKKSGPLPEAVLPLVGTHDWQSLLRIPAVRVTPLR
ncbi:MAG: hypothetical protein AMXMBFR64_26880 [Myxococcales bacterium]